MSPPEGESELERERKLSAQWQERFEKAKEELRELEDRTGELHREAAARGAWSKELQETLTVVDRARARLSAALDAARREAAAMRGRAEALKADLERKEAALRQAEQIYEAACRTFSDESTNHQAECQRLLGEIERISSDHQQSQGRLTEERQRLERDREKLLTEVNRAMESAESVRREGIEAFEEALELKRRIKDGGAA